MITQGVSCQVCGKQRAPGLIHKGESKILKGQIILICNKCATEKKEPRSFIIIMARTGEKGFDKVKPWLKDRRYEGPPILGEELA